MIFSIQYVHHAYLNPHPAEVSGGTIGRGGAYLPNIKISYTAVLEYKYLDMTHHINVKFHEESVFRV